MAHTHSTQDDFLVSGTPDRRSSPSYSPTGSLESLQLLLQAPELSVIPDGEVTLEAAHLLSHVVDPSSDGDEEEEGLLDGASKPHRQRSWNPKRWFEKASPWHELNLIFVTLTQASIPGGYWFLLATSVTDGLFGGVYNNRIATAGAVLHANRVFSMYMGFLFIGMTVGPTFGSFMVRMTQDLLTPFYIALVAHCFLAFYMWFIIPESLSPALMRQHRDKHSLERLKSLLTLFRPLGVFLPRRRDADEHRPGRDWNLTLLAIAYAITTSYISLSQFKSQYAIAVFGWTAEDLGYWLSLIGGSRALYLIIILPFLTKFLRSKEMSRTVSPNLTDSAPNAERRSRSSSQVRHTADAAQGGVKAYNTAQLDVRIARVSVFIEVVSFGVIILSMGPQSWTLGSVVGSFGAGLQPSLQSLALFLTGGQENGKLFGALAVVSALGGQVVGPAVFGAIYVSTVGSFPKAIFLAAITGSIIAFTAVSLIRLPVREIRVVSERQDEEA
ncbi:hypothetical protein FRB99_006018 [Tulasnella sp. 403]|nr:hypothetical protein FRB99_006018 [Tulasnella sp. 403]